MEISEAIYASVVYPSLGDDRHRAGDYRLREIGWRVVYQLRENPGDRREGAEVERMKRGGLLQNSRPYRVGEVVMGSFIPPNTLNRSEQLKGQGGNVTVVLRWKEG